MYSEAFVVDGNLASGGTGKTNFRHSTKSSRVQFYAGRHHLWRRDVSALQTIVSIYPINHYQISKHNAMAGKSTGKDLTLAWARSKQNPLTSNLTLSLFNYRWHRTRWLSPASNMRYPFVCFIIGAKV